MLRPHPEAELIAAGNAARRMHHDGVAHLAAFRVQRLLHDERTVVHVPAEGCFPVLKGKIEGKAGFPGTDQRLGYPHRPIIPCRFLATAFSASPASTAAAPHSLSRGRPFSAFSAER